MPDEARKKFGFHEFVKNEIDVDTPIGSGSLRGPLRAISGCRRVGVSTARQNGPLYEWSRAACKTFMMMVPGRAGPIPDSVVRLGP